LGYTYLVFMRKNAFVLIALLALLLAGLFLIRTSRNRAESQARYQTQPARRGDLQVTVDADGIVHSAQTAILVWRTSGIVETVGAQAGQTVSAKQVLASLEQTSLPQALILAQTEWIDARRALDDLLQSQSEQAQAQKVLEDAQQALEDASQPALTQAQAQAAVARAQKAVENARRDVEIVRSPASGQSIQSAYGILLLWENTLRRTRNEIEQVQNRLGSSRPGGSREGYQDQLESLLLQWVTYQRSYEDALHRYSQMLQPPDPVNVAQAEANLAAALAQLDQAQRAYARLENGTSPADVAVLQAQVEDAIREVERLKDGPDPDRVAAARARLAAAQAALDLRQLAAPFDGVVTYVNVQPADLVTPGSRAFRIDDLSTLLLDVRVSEIDINRLQPGQTVTIRLDAVRGKEYTGVVAEVPPVGDVVDDAVTFAVRIKIQDADSQVRPQMTGSAQVVLESLKDVLLVPSRAIRLLDGQRVIYVLKNGKPEPAKVTLGVTSAEEVEVLEGELQPGDEIVINPGG